MEDVSVVPVRSATVTWQESMNLQLIKFEQSENRQVKRGTRDYYWGDSEHTRVCTRGLKSSRAEMRLQRWCATSRRRCSLIWRSDRSHRMDSRSFHDPSEATRFGGSILGSKNLIWLWFDPLSGRQPAFEVCVTCSSRRRSAEKRDGGRLTEEKISVKNSALLLCQPSFCPGFLRVSPLWFD